MIQRLQRDDAPDAGFTLMEVLVALALIAIVASASLAFFINGTRTVTTQQRQQNATSIANEAMEDSFSRVAKFSTTKTSGMVVGRTKAEVQAAWSTATAAGVVGLSDAFPDWDASTSPAPSAGTGDDAVKLTYQVEKSRIKYTVTTLFGSCYRSTTLPGAPCTKSGGTAAWVADPGYQRMIRAAVMVTWPDITGSCGGTVCTYNISSLIDPNHDLKWNNTTLILAADDSLAMDADATPVNIDVLDNDTLPALTSNPVASVTQPLKPSTTAPSMGSTTINADGTIKFDPNDDAHGEVTFRYTITIGARTTTGTVHVYVNPLAVNYSSAAVVGVPGSVPIKTRYGTNPVSIELTGSVPPGVSVAGTSIKWTPTTAGTKTITYTYTDSEAMVSRPGTVTLNVTNYAPPVNGPVTISIPASSSNYALNLQTATNNLPAANYRVRVLGQASPSTGTSLRVDGVQAVAAGTTGTSVTFTPEAKKLAVYTFTYEMLDLDGNKSPVATATIRTQPVAQPDAFTVTKSGKSTVKTELDVGANDGAFANTKFTVLSALPNNCGSIDSSKWATNGKVTYSSPTSARTCSFTYRITPNDSGYQTSNTVTVTLKVNN
ncbi:Ig-like domain-containing protein [Cellulomonas fengjieae]|uniref:Ig-like domain-containing protein n=1 Tax=Cellulomonas fengjieae TaxID=2819978 RepID=UPI001AAF0CDE|nr:Ig-like domain-containing protein [Cellulomonas fengjieae]MBO3102653.1 cadherin-like domain-containing protein [Cellulomonas fengjieae]